jgi:hypothetical protein
MARNKQKLQGRSSFIHLIFAFFIVLGAMSMSEKILAGTDLTARPGFGISRLGGHDYGTNGIGVWLSGDIHVGLSRIGVLGPFRDRRNGATR